MKSSARQSVVGGEALPSGNAPAAPAREIDLARRRLDEALARLEKEVTARVAQVRAEAKSEWGAKLAGLETEIAKLKTEKRALERTCAELRKAAESAGGRVDQALAQVQALLGSVAAEGAGGG